MKRILFSLLIGVAFISCGEPSTEEKIKTNLKSHENKEVSEVVIVDTVFVTDVKARLSDLDNALITIKESAEKLPILLGEAKTRLKEAESNLLSTSNAVLKFGYNDLVQGEKANVESLEKLISENGKLLENDKTLRVEIDKKLQAANETIAFINVTAKVEGELKTFTIAPNLKVIDLD